MADGYRESTESWADLLRDCARRGMRAPVLAVGDGALGFWKAAQRGVPRHPASEVLGSQTGQRPGRPAEVRAARRAGGDPGDLQRRGQRPRRRRRSRRSRASYGAKYPKAVVKITDDDDELLAFYDFPAEHWIHLRTTNPIESTFATVRLRTKVTKGAGLPGRRPGHGLQAHRVRPGPLAGGERTPPRRPRPRRRTLPKRPTARTPHRHHPGGEPARTGAINRNGGRLNTTSTCLDNSSPTFPIWRPTSFLATQRTLRLHLLRLLDLAHSAGAGPVSGRCWRIRWRQVDRFLHRESSDRREMTA